MIDAYKLGRAQDRWTILWHEPDTDDAADEELTKLSKQNHRANFDLWHEEDKTRDPLATNAEIARVKRSIDGLNQRRNDVVEMIDMMAIRAAPQPGAQTPLHSETPGMMIDRMSILALKIFHTREQITRPGTSESHRSRNAERLKILEEQRADLTKCLADLWTEILGSKRTFKIYRQMKMYNDPELNPMIYGGLVVEDEG